MVIGSPIVEAYRRFGKRPSLAAPPVEPRCVYFRYDPDLVDYSTALVLLVREGRIEQKWLIEKEAAPKACDGLAAETVDLVGYYDAAWCCDWTVQWSR